RFTESVVVEIFSGNLGEGELEKLRDVLKNNKGVTPVTVALNLPSGGKVNMLLGKGFCVKPSERFMKDVVSLLGENTVWLKIKR
ncbi:MAG: hypothetical protein KAS46_00065, partial [Candidatus Aureabacteria bacterium]|nr:hypothetical protein [Candidatus Auribacterota bacterium]